jgi:predicted TPR repeat methyltransferase
VDELNKELIDAKKRIVEIKSLQEELEKESTSLKNKIHLYFDSSKFDTSDTEEYIINYFWQNATYSSEFYTSVLKQNYTKMRLSQIVKKYVSNNSRALDVGCGSGLYTEHLATIFEKVVGLDLSQARIEKNIKDNKFKNIVYLSENFITCATEKLGKFNLIFASDLGMYSHKKYLKKTFKALLNLLTEDGILLTRESTSVKGNRSSKSYNYVAYYRNKKYYKKGIYKDNFIKSYRDCSYNIPQLNKYFSIYPSCKEDIENNPFLLNKIVKEFIDEDLGSSHYYVYKNNIR